MKAKLGGLHYPLVGVTIGGLKLIGALLFLISLVGGGYLFLRAGAPPETLSDSTLDATFAKYRTGDLRLGIVILMAAGMLLAILIGALGQFLAMQRDRTIHATVQTQLLEDILELNEETTAARSGTQVDMCDGCGKLGALHRIDSGQWMCRECRRQLRSA